MNRRPPDIDVFFEIRRLADRLDPRHFEALNGGIELGRVRAVRRSTPSATPYVSGYPQPASPLQQSVATPAVNPDFSLPPYPFPMPHTQSVAPPVVSAKPSGFVRWLSAHAFDLVIVVFTLMIAGLGVEFFFTPQNFQDEPFSKLLPFAVVRYLGLLKTALVTAIIFMAYWIIFRAFAGATLGELLMRSRFFTKKLQQSKLVG